LRSPAGDLVTAAARFQLAADIVPLPEYVIALGEVDEARGDATGAATNFGLARIETQLFQANGVIVDLELGLFEVDHGDPVQGLALAEQAYGERKTVKAADTLAWALLKNGQVAKAVTMSKQATRLGSQDPIIRYHAGMIEAAAGQTSAARRDLQLALKLDSGFSATGVVAIRAELARLG
jgi:tetratricopeptide (TPR) repeat protein